MAYVSLKKAALPSGADIHFMDFAAVCEEKSDGQHMIGKDFLTLQV